MFVNIHLAIECKPSDNGLEYLFDIHRLAQQLEYKTAADLQNVHVNGKNVHLCYNVPIDATPVFTTLVYNKLESIIGAYSYTGNIHYSEDISRRAIPPPLPEEPISLPTPQFIHAIGTVTRSTKKNEKKL